MKTPLEKSTCTHLLTPRNKAKAAGLNRVGLGQIPESVTV